VPLRDHAWRHGARAEALLKYVVCCLLFVVCLIVGYAPTIPFVLPRRALAFALWEEDRTGRRMPSIMFVLSTSFELNVKRSP
jgi:hypothetical protein